MRHTTAEGYSYEAVSTVDGQPPFPELLLARSRSLLDGTLGMFQPLGPAVAIASRIFARYPVHARRAEAAAAAMGVDPVELLAANLSYDLLLGMNGMGCSTLALPGADGPILARNMDWYPAGRIAMASCLVREEFGVNAGFVGLLGAVTGLSRRGFGICLNAVFGGSDPDGYPMLLFIRHVLDEAANYAEALAMIEREPLMSSGIITIVGMRNEERAIVERVPHQAAARSVKRAEPIMATNHFRELAMPETCPRYQFMAGQAGIHPPLEILTNRKVLQDITAQHVVMCPATQAIEMFVPSHLLPDAAGK